MARKGYPPEFRRRVVKLIESGRKVAEVATEPGLSTAERAELAAAKRRIHQLEAEVAIHRRATELLKDKTHPK